MSISNWRKYIEEAPLPCDGAPIWERPGLSDEEQYVLCIRSLARGLLVLSEEDPSLLDVPDRVADPKGFEAADNRKLWDAFKARWPDGDEWLGGVTGYQWGWAHNMVRHVVGLGPLRVLPTARGALRHGA